MSLDVTLLTEEQIWGNDQGNGQLQMMKDYGTKAGMSDLCIMLGGAIDNGCKTSDGQRAGSHWSASYKDGDVYSVHSNGYRTRLAPTMLNPGARPALPSSVTSSIGLNKAKPSRKISGVDVVEYGEYPQVIASDRVSRKLEQSFSRGQLQTTGKTYTLDGERYDDWGKPLIPRAWPEYQRRGERYIRKVAKCPDGPSLLSNDRKLYTGDVCWIEVQPIEWLKDPSGVMVARQALFSGVEFDRKQKYHGNFENTDMMQYLQTGFAKEIQVSREVGFVKKHSLKTLKFINKLMTKDKGFTFEGTLRNLPEPDEYFKETEIIIDEGTKQEQFPNQATEEEKQIIGGAQYRPLDMKNGNFGHLAREFANKTAILNDAVIDWGYHWSRMNPSEEPNQAKKDLKQLITDILSVYDKSPENKVGKAVHKLRKQFSEEQLDKLVSNLYKTLLTEEELINKQGLAEETIEYLHGAEVSTSFVEKIQNKKVEVAQTIL